MDNNLMNHNMHAFHVIQRLHQHFPPIQIPHELVRMPPNGQNNNNEHELPPQDPEANVQIIRAEIIPIVVPEDQPPQRNWRRFINISLLLRLCIMAILFLGKSSLS